MNYYSARRSCQLLAYLILLPGIALLGACKRSSSLSLQAAQKRQTIEECRAVFSAWSGLPANYLQLLQRTDNLSYSTGVKGKSRYTTKLVLTDSLFIACSFLADQRGDLKNVSGVVIEMKELSQKSGGRVITDLEKSENVDEKTIKMLLAHPENTYEILNWGLEYTDPREAKTIDWKLLPQF